MLRKRPAVAIAASTFAVAATVAMATPASAATVGMKCSKSGYYATGNVNYINRSSRHYIYSYDWVIHGQQHSTKNDVTVILYRDVFGPDDMLNGFSSGREKNGYGVHRVSYSYPMRYKLYGFFYFVFDINNRPDPACKGETGRF